MGESSGGGSTPVEDTFDIGGEVGVRRGQRGAPPVPDDAPHRREPAELTANDFPQATPHAVALNGFAEGARRGEASLGSAGGGNGETEGDKVARGNTNALVVHLSELGRLQQTAALAKGLGWIRSGGSARAAGRGVSCWRSGQPARH